MSWWRTACTWKPRGYQLIQKPRRVWSRLSESHAWLNLMTIELLSTYSVRRVGMITIPFQHLPCTRPSSQRWVCRKQWLRLFACEHEMLVGFRLKMSPTGSRVSITCPKHAQTSCLIHRHACFHFDNSESRVMQGGIRDNSVQNLYGKEEIGKDYVLARGR